MDLWSIHTLDVSAYTWFFSRKTTCMKNALGQSRFALVYKVVRHVLNRHMPPPASVPLGKWIFNYWDQPSETATAFMYPINLIWREHALLKTVHHTPGYIPLFVWFK